MQTSLGALVNASSKTRNKISSKRRSVRSRRCSRGSADPAPADRPRCEPDRLERGLGHQFSTDPEVRVRNNRISPRRLLEIAQRLQVPVTDFLNGALPGSGKSQSRSDPEPRRADLELMKWFSMLSPRFRKEVTRLVRLWLAAAAVSRKLAAGPPAWQKGALLRGKLDVHNPGC